MKVIEQMRYGRARDGGWIEREPKMSRRLRKRRVRMLRRIQRDRADLFRLADHEPTVEQMCNPAYMTRIIHARHVVASIRAIEELFIGSAITHRA